MPLGDRTGPAGFGPMTGRAAGYCAGYPVPGYANPVPGRGFGRGRGFYWYGWGRGRAGGRGFRGMYRITGMPGWMRAGYAPVWGPYWNPAVYTPYGGPSVAPYADPVNPEEEKDMLKAQAADLKEQLDLINKRLEELEKQKNNNEDK